jgi:hypothetical protein
VNDEKTFTSSSERGGERVRLIDTRIDRVQNSCDQYQSTRNIEQIMRAIWKLVLHSVLSNENPQHDPYPAGPDSWHNYRK